MSIHILASNKSVRNTTLSCDSMGIHYEVSKLKQEKDSVVSVHRWESTTNQNTLIGQIEFHWFAPDRLRLMGTGNDGWQRRKDILNNQESNPLSRCVISTYHIFLLITSRTRTFTGNNGVRYKWRFHWDSLRLHHADDDAVNKDPLVIFHRHFMASRPSYLEICDTSVLPGLDSIIGLHFSTSQILADRDVVTFLYMEKKRRDRDKAQRRHGAGGGP